MAKIDRIILRSVIERTFGVSLGSDKPVVAALLTNWTAADRAAWPTHRRAMVTTALQLEAHAAGMPRAAFCCETSWSYPCPTRQATVDITPPSGPPDRRESSRNDEITTRDLQLPVTSEESVFCKT